MRTITLAVGLLGAALGIASAQTGGEITGEVRDPSGALVSKRARYGHQHWDQLDAVDPNQTPRDFIVSPI